MSSLFTPWERKAVDHSAENLRETATGGKCEETKGLICPRGAVRAGCVTTADIFLLSSELPLLHRGEKKEGEKHECPPFEK